jgi:tripeptidyl-peptidase-1
MRFSASLILALTSICLASPLTKRWGDFEVKHSWADVPRGWTYHSPAAKDHVLHMSFALKQGNFGQLVEHLYQSSDPKHENYGQHLSKEEVAQLVAPHQETKSIVEEWLAAHSIDTTASVRQSSGGDWLVIPLTVGQVEELLGTSYNVYHNAESDSYVVRTTAYSLPAALHDHVNLVAPTTYFGNMKAMKKTSFLQPELDHVKDNGAGHRNNAVPAASCDTAITIDCLRTLYNTADYTPAKDRTTLGIAGYLDEYANHADLKTFLAKYRPDANGTSYTDVSIKNGGNDQSKPGVEANLDIQYTVGMSAPIPNTYYSTGGSPPFIPDTQTPTNTNEPYLDWVNFVLDQDSMPDVVSTSYGDDEQTVPEDYARTVCDQFVQVGSRGTSLLFSSGDFGVGGGDCLTNDGKNTTRFQPAFPASCPYVTTIGGTVKTNPEVAVDFTGGGFSNYFPRPDYQKDAVSGFLSGLGDTYDGLYNATGRAYPDIAAQGSGFRVVIGGRVQSVGGTSASCPTVAAIISLLNDYSISQGKSKLGFLNPLIYSSLASGFNDITSGNNPGCDTDGFTAGEGWDPVTGLGTPDFAKLQKLI